jgi:hypothetical protein
MRPVGSREGRTVPVAVQPRVAGVSAADVAVLAEADLAEQLQDL